jgi:hypothetical protein
MTQKKNDHHATRKSRRTGLDRRWIPSTGHQPERRRGVDRRKTRKRSFTDPFLPEASRQETAALPDVAADPPNAGTAPPAGNPPLGIWPPQHPDSVSGDRTDKDGTCRNDSKSKAKRQNRSILDFSLKRLN